MCGFPPFLPPRQVTISKDDTVILNALTTPLFLHPPTHITTQPHIAHPCLPFLSMQVTISKDDTVILNGLGDKAAIQERCVSGEGKGGAAWVQ